MSRVIISLLIPFVLVTCADPDEASSQDFTLRKELVIDNLSVPWGLAFLPDGAMLVTERRGELIHFKDGVRTQISGLPSIYVRGQGGLLDVEPHPDYEENGWLYLSYSSTEGPGSGGNTALMRARLDQFTLVDKQVLYKGEENSGSGIHFGSRISFDDDGFLYFTIGDRGSRDQNPQDLRRDGGKVYRLHDDGRIPDDNPFVGQNGAKTAIYSYGHRNPQGMAKHPFTGEIWTHEHGPQGGDEVNIIQAGKNYGWPEITYGEEYGGGEITPHTAKEGMEQPLHYWVPSIAPCGMDFVMGDRYPGWEGDLLVGALKFSYLARLDIENGKVLSEERLVSGIGRVRSVKMGPDGYIYIGVEGQGIYRLVPEAN